MEIVRIVTTFLTASAVILLSWLALWASLRKYPLQALYNWGWLTSVLFSYGIIGFLSAPSTLTLAWILPCAWAATLTWVYFLAEDEALVWGFSWALTWTVARVWAKEWIGDTAVFWVGWILTGAIASALTVVNGAALESFFQYFSKFQAFIVFAGFSLLGLGLGFLVYQIFPIKNMVSG
ncbi:MAG: hypothetical protein KME60_12725 [Cyanomargarita calcarea GSE-NOS-MK-12-04C]|jgi:serine/threonine-protein kinase|uniref:Uncharacterized protein n=1 Tax=Cyanomargarita calcarea GSE-NOS-MK-12-04C TaxID=2839659 RepID=A0A951QM43_9CYAN|nr:hypothetical protein [Cyanomargarita calcarea GSE-NOS-MK-12-04C]